MWAKRVAATAVAVSFAALVTAVPAYADTSYADAPRTECSAAFFHGDKRLGPEVLPTRGAVGRELRGWQRTGYLNEQQFLDTYYDSTQNSWRYPPDNGYVIGPDGRPEVSQRALWPSEEIDRYGSEYGTFLAPDGSPYASRAIPPQSLDGTPPPGCNYHVYRVSKQFSVDAGPIAAWFAQPGGGVQYQLDATLVPGSPAQLNVMWLVDNGYLERLR